MSEQKTSYRTCDHRTAEQAHMLDMLAGTRKRIIDMLERFEDRATAPLHIGPAGRVERTRWQRTSPLGSPGPTSPTAPSGSASENGDFGGGESGLLRGRLFEKAGVHLSCVHGPVPEGLGDALPGADGEFWAAGVSVIIHPHSPRIPAAHMNLRMITTTGTWFGGGADLTPLLADQRRGDNPDAVAFHAAMEQACTSCPKADHAAFKANCTRYFHLPHRKEERGVGGIFFDHFTGSDTASDIAFLAQVGAAFADVYETILARRMLQSWSAAEREEQLIRRGRYVEFNLLYDRGTRFGLKSDGNIESILSSLPPTVKWP